MSSQDFSATASALMISSPDDGGVDIDPLARNGGAYIAPGVSGRSPILAEARQSVQLVVAADAGGAPPRANPASRRRDFFVLDTPSCRAQSERAQTVTRPELSILPELLRRLPALRQLFDGLAAQTALAVEKALEWVRVNAGDVLFEEGDPAPDAFVVTAGQLAVVVGAGARRHTVARINPGELVGEMALLTDAPRSATIVALYDSYLIRMPRQALDALMDDAPEARRFLFRVLSERLRHTSSDPSPQKAAEKIAIVPLGPMERADETLAWLTRKVSPIIIASAKEEDRWGEGGAPAGRPIVYMADGHRSAWAKRCIDRSDRVVFVANAGAAPAGLDTVVAAARLNREMSFVLVNRPVATLPTGAARWLGHFQPSQILHVRQGDGADYERVLRLISRSSVCVVFSGGGARALAHIGAVQALEENGIPIDAVAGTSMGALIAALVAQGVKASEIHDRMRRYLVDNNPIGEYTLPLVSLVRGRKLTSMFKEACDGANVEDLWKTFFCVSTDLTTNAAVVHQSGPLWRALRASSAIPGLLPPVTGDGQVLVDGAIVDNMPTAAMRSPIAGR